MNIKGDSHAIFQECSSYAQRYKTWVYNDQRAESRIATTGHHCSHGRSQLEHAYWQVVSQIHSAIFDLPSGISKIALCYTPGRHVLTITNITDEDGGLEKQERAHKHFLE